MGEYQPHSFIQTCITDALQNVGFMFDCSCYGIKALLPCENFYGLCNGYMLRRANPGSISECL